MVGGSLRLYKPGRAEGVQNACRETEQEEKNETPGRSAKESVSPISKSSSDRKPRDEFGGNPHGLA